MKKHRWAIPVVLGVAGLIASAVAGPASASPLSGDCAAGSSMYVVAHQDDTLFFANPQLAHDVGSKMCVTTVFVTAGDAGKGNAYATSREKGAEAGYSVLSGVSNSWTYTNTTIGGSTLRRATLDENPRVTLTYLRLPDGGFPDGLGYPVTGDQSIRKLWTGAQSTITAVDGSATYTRDTLIASLLALMNEAKPSVIATQNTQGSYGGPDHPDHLTTAFFTRQAQLAYAAPHVLRSYQGYDVVGKPANVGGGDLLGKEAAYYAYTPYDSNTCGTPAACAADGSDQWLRRQYTTNNSISGNLAELATVTSSSQNTASGQSAANVADGVIGGYPADQYAEWATVGGAAGSWVQMSLPSASTVSRVTLYDRPNPNDNVLSGTLAFSDGSVVAVGALPNDGSAFGVSFPARSTTSVRFTINSVSSTTLNVGLSEFQLWQAMSPSPTTLAGNAATASGADWTGQDLSVGRYVAVDSGTAGHIEAQIANAGTGRLKAAVYSDIAGSPGTLLAQTSELSGYAAGINTLSLTSGVDLTVGTAYWIAIWSDSPSLRVLADPGGNGRYVAVPYGAWPTTMPGTSTNGHLYNLVLKP